MVIAEPILNFYRTALNFSLHYNNVLLEGQQRIRQYQIDQIEASLADYASCYQKLENNADQAQLQEISAELARLQAERFISYWSGIANAFGQNQLELAGVCQSRAMDMARGLTEQVQQAPAVMPNPLMESFKIMAEAVGTTLTSASQIAQDAADARSVPASSQAGQSTRRKQQDIRLH